MFNGFSLTAAYSHEIPIVFAECQRLRSLPLDLLEASSAFLSGC